jgi:hypothetical protein
VVTSVASSGEGMGGNRGVEIIDPCTSALERGLDLPVGVTDGIGPFGPRQLRANEIEPLLQCGPALRTRQSLDAEGDLGEHGLWDGDTGRLGDRQLFDERWLSLHQRRHDVGVQDVDHKSRGRFECRARVTADSSSSTAAFVS